MKILVVEDDESIRILLEKVLGLKDYTVVLAEDGEQGLSLAQAENPDLIIMDLQMPVMDGFKAMKAMRKIESLETTPILALTAQVATENYDKVYEAGANGYLAKPIDFDRLYERVEELLKI